MLRRTALLLLPLASLLAGCDMLGIETGPVIAAKKEAEGKAIGGACRHGLRAIEDCYTLNPKAQKSAVYAGWREMDEYLRETKSEGIVPVIPRKPARPASAPEPADAASAAGEGAGHGDKPGSGANAHDTPPGAAERSSRSKRAATTH
jgi:hypothetical protein